MIESTTGIVINTIKYSEKSKICKIYTKEYGMQTYIVSRTKKNKGFSACFQKLNILNIASYKKTSSEIKRIKDFELKIGVEQKTNPQKILVLIFISEILQKCLKEEVGDSTIFNFLENSIKKIHYEKINNSFLLYFLVELSLCLGFCPDNNINNDSYFDLANGFFCSKKPKHEQYIENQNLKSLEELLTFSFKKIENKKEMLSILVTYYSLHVEGFKNLNSLDTIKTVLYS